MPIRCHIAFPPTYSALLSAFSCSSSSLYPDLLPSLWETIPTRPIFLSLFLLDVDGMHFTTNETHIISVGIEQQTICMYREDKGHDTCEYAQPGKKVRSIKRKSYNWASNNAWRVGYAWHDLLRRSIGSFHSVIYTYNLHARR